jgi:2-desacetyl-2-hydroxyethyl bacteriochlorophyllide A dehydrogenase
MKPSQTLYFSAPRTVDIHQEAIPEPGPGEVMVRTLVSAISPGTEMLFYRGQMPEGLTVDATLSGMDHPFSYPLKYGYSAAGEVCALGAGVDSGWLGRRVFAFHPHQSLFNLPLVQLFPIPNDISFEDAVFLPNMETAVNLVMDGAPVIGEQAAVFGQGIVGLLTCALLTRFPLAGSILTFDRFAMRRLASQRLGQVACLDPGQPDWLEAARGLLKVETDEDGVDLVFEISGAPEALNQALKLCAYNGRIIVGSWYGSKQAALDLGGRFHRSRIRLVSSQVSSLAPRYSGRWDKARRFGTAWEMIRQVRPAQWITQRIALEQASQAYRLLDEAAGETLQVVLTY